MNKHALTSHRLSQNSPLVGYCQVWTQQVVETWELKERWSTRRQRREPKTEEKSPYPPRRRRSPWTCTDHFLASEPHPDCHKRGNIIVCVYWHIDLWKFLLFKHRPERGLINNRVKVIIPEEHHSPLPKTERERLSLMQHLADEVATVIFTHPFIHRRSHV